jgi:homoserine O-acetyltransferase/O-succinyltransferase
MDVGISGSLGTVKTQFYTFAQNSPFETEGGKPLSPVTLAYETYGALNADRSNAVLILPRGGGTS